MKKNGIFSKWFRLLTVGLLIALTVIFFASCDKDTPDDSDAPDSSEVLTDDETETVLTLVSDKKSNYKIIYPQDCDEYVLDAASTLRKYIKETTDVGIRSVSDGGNTPSEESEYEILIGETNRKESSEQYRHLDYNGSKASIYGKKIVLAAHNEEKLDDLIELFTRRLELSEDSQTLTLSKLDISRTGSYGIKSISFGNNDLWNYGIVVSDNDQLVTAKYLRYLIGESSGVMMQVYTDASSLPEGIKPFYIGNKVTPSTSSDNTYYSFGQTGDGIALYYTDSEGRARAYGDFVKALIDERTETVDISSAIVPSVKQSHSNEAAELKIMSFNVLNGWSSNNIGNRDDLAATKILQFMPDVLCLQEFDTFYRNASGTPLTSLISSNYLEAGESEGSWNPIFYNKNTVNLLSYGFHAYSDGTSYTYPGGGDSLFRTFTWALFEDKATGKQFLVFNTHLDYTSGDSNKTAENQRSECAELTAKISELKELFGVTNVFLTGDLNSSISGTACTSLLSFGFKDTHAMATTKDDIGSAGQKGVAITGTYSSAIDHVFCIGQNISVSEYKTVTDIRDASDHCPVCVTLKIS